MLNYRHLYYFWVVTKEGGFARAAKRLDMAVQTRPARSSGSGCTWVGPGSGPRGRLGASSTTTDVGGGSDA